MFQIKAFPADDGDCLLLSYGKPSKRRHMLVDGGRASAYPKLRPHLSAIAAAGEPLELLVLTHIDADHIEGMLAMANDPALPIVPGRVWYNGYDQMARIQAFGEKQGDAYSARLAELGWPLNPEFAGGTASIEAAPEPIQFGGLSLRLLSPDAAHLRKMRDRWTLWRTEQAAKEEAERMRAAQGGVQVMGRDPIKLPIDVEKLKAPTSIDPEPPNGSSIALLAEYRGKRVLLAGDAHPDLLAQTIAPLAAAEGGRLRVDLFKVSHHGSHGNTTRELVELLDCQRFLISTNGSRHGHPDPQAIARLLAYSGDGAKTLYFNYKTKRTEPWDNAELKTKHDYAAVFAGADGLLDLEI